MAVLSNVDRSIWNCRYGPNVVQVDWQCGRGKLTALQGAVCEGRVYLFVCLLVWPLLPTHRRCRGYCCIWSHSMTHTHTHTHTHPHTPHTHTHTRMGRISMKPAAFEPVIPAIERPQTYVRVTTTLYPQPTQQSKTTFVWAYIVRHVWPL